MTAEILAATEHLVLRRMTNDAAAALAAYRSDPVQARYQSWETPYPVDSARALIAQMRNVRFAQPGVWLQIGIETSGRLIGDIAVRVDGDQARQATVGFTLAADGQGHGYATEALRTVISLLFTEHDVHRICADCDTRNDRSVSLLNASARAARLTTTSQPGGKVNGPTSTSTPSSPRNGQTRATEQTHNRRPKPEVETASWHLTSKLTNQPTSGAPVSPFLAWMCSHEERPDFLPESFYVVVVPWFGRPAK
jgi:aminoglycoside 6'-N-acetyltransferase